MVIKFSIYLFLLINSNTILARPKKSAPSKEELHQKILKLQTAVKSMSADARLLNQWMKNQNKRMPKISINILRAYYDLGLAHGHLYAGYASGDEKEEDYKNYLRAKKYFQPPILYEYKVDQAEAIMEKLDNIRLRRSKLVSTFKFRAMLQYMSYQETALLKNSFGENEIYSPQKGYCAGVQFAYGNLQREWTVDTCFYLSQGDVTVDPGAGPTYSQSNVKSTGFLIKPTYWWQLSDGEASVGAGVPLLVRSVDYTDPPDGTVEERSPLLYGFSVDGRWKLVETTYLATSFGVLDSSLLWSLGVAYGF